MSVNTADKDRFNASVWFVVSFSCITNEINGEGIVIIIVRDILMWPSKICRINFILG